jgi:hypothetical protein
MTLVISPVMVFDVLTIVHWRQDKAVAFITLPLLAAALWAFWRGAFMQQPETPTKTGQAPPKAIEGAQGHAEVRRHRRQR